MELQRFKHCVGARGIDTDWFAAIFSIMSQFDQDIVRIAVVEDDQAALDRVNAALAVDPGLVVTSVARNVADGRRLVEAGGYDVLLCDLGLPDGSGISLIRLSAQMHPKSDVIVITIFAEQEKVLESIKAGARGFLLKDDRFEQCAEGIREIRRGGSPISPSIARQLLKEFQPQAAGKELAELLSKREAEVLNLLARGFSFVEIGDLLKISRSTVATHVKNIYQKLEVNSRSEAVFEASSLGIIDMPHQGR